MCRPALCRHALPGHHLLAMVEVLSLMRSMVGHLEESEIWLQPLLHQAMHAETRTFVTVTLPNLTRHTAAGKVCIIGH